MKSRYQSVVFSTDMYIPKSVKSMERLRKGTSQKLLIGGSKTKKPKEWKLFLKNDENKKRLIQMLLEIWSSESYVDKIKGGKLFFICDGIATQLTTENNKIISTSVIGIQSNQEETDSRVILYCFYARNCGYKYVIVRSPDSDIFFILLSYIHDLSGITVL